MARPHHSGPRVRWLPLLQRCHPPTQSIRRPPPEHKMKRVSPLLAIILVALPKVFTHDWLDPLAQSFNCESRAFFAAGGTFELLALVLDDLLEVFVLENIASKSPFPFSFLRNRNTADLLLRNDDYICLWVSLVTLQSAGSLHTKSPDAFDAMKARGCMFTVWCMRSCG